MRRLMLLRHAKSSWSDDTLPDHERPLNKRGKRTAPMVGRRLRSHDLVPELIVSSTAKRARATAEAVAEAAGVSSPLEFRDELYLASAGELLLQAQSFPDPISTAMLVAHNPGMEDLVRILSGRVEAFPTAALGVFAIEIDTWQELDPGATIRVEHLWRPRELE